jgi:hypothetical protein
MKCDAHREDESAHKMTEEMMTRPRKLVFRRNRIGSQSLITEENLDGQVDFSEFNG